MNKKKYFFILLSLFISCGTTFISQEDLIKKFGIESIPTKAEYPDDDGVILFEQTKISFDKNSNDRLVQVREYKNVTLVFSNFASFRNIEIPLSENQELIRIDAKVRNPDGSLDRVPENAFLEYQTTLESSKAFQEKKIIAFSFPKVFKGAILEYSYKIQSTTLLPSSKWFFQHSIPNLRTEYSLEFPEFYLNVKWINRPKFKLRYKFYNFKEITFDKPKFVEGKIAFHADLCNVPPLRKETFMPSILESAGYVDFSFTGWENYSEIGSWYNKNFIKPLLSKSSAINTRANELTQECERKVEKVQRLYSFVQEMEYIPIDLGEGGIIPSMPLSVLERKYGDCKDKSILLVALLRSQGILATPVLLMTADKGITDKTFPSFSFNHMIVKAIINSTEAIWLDPTTGNHKAGELPWQCQGISALVLDSGGSAYIESTPIGSPEKNKTVYKTHIEVAPLGNYVSYNIDARLYGESYMQLRGLFDELGKYQAKQYIISKIIKEIKNPEISNVQFDYYINEAGKRYFRVQLHFIDTLLSGRDQDCILVPITPLKLDNISDWICTGERIYPLHIKYPCQIINNIEFNYNSNKFSPRNVPGKYYENIKEFLFENNVETSSNTVKINNKLTINDKIINKENYSLFRNKLEKIHDIRVRNLVLLNTLL